MPTVGWSHQPEWRHRVFRLFFKRFQDLRDIGGARIAAIGPATAAKIEKRFHLQVDLIAGGSHRLKNREGF